MGSLEIGRVYYKSCKYYLAVDSDKLLDGYFQIFTPRSKYRTLPITVNQLEEAWQTKIEEVDKIFEYYRVRSKSNSRLNST